MSRRTSPKGGGNRGRRSGRAGSSTRPAAAARAEHDASLSASASPSPSPSASPSPTTGWWVAGIACLLVALVSASFLSLTHLGQSLPGCGPQSACDAVTSSVWGRVPLIGWPTAFVGAAWFGGLLAGWLLSDGRLGWPTWLLAGLGGVLSLLLIGVMLVHGTLCPWCLASHAGNLGFLGVALLSVERASVPRVPGGRRGVAALAMVAIAITAGLAIADAQVTSRQRAADEATRAAATDEIIAQARGGPGGAEGSGASEGAESRTSLEPAGAGADADDAADTAEDADAERAAATSGPRSTPTSTPTPADGAPPFTGRWRLGPERAPIRFVVFMDYQCPDCRTAETEIARLVKERGDVSLSIKHFPFNPPCNRLARSLNFNPHPNACWAARAAEAAGVLGGNDGFWRMHEVLFARNGSFTDAELPELVAAEDFVPDAFVRTMTSRLTLQRVEADVEEGIALGLTSTPTIFVNGVELGGWRVPGALERTVERLAAEGLPVRSAAEAGDRPPTAADKFVDSWASSRRVSTGALERRTEPESVAEFGTGSRAAATVVVFGDLSDEQARRVDARVRARVDRDPRVRYVFRHLPLDRACNPQAPAQRDSGGCLAARLAIAAGRLGGAEAARAAHGTLAARPAPVDGGAIAAVAAAAGVSPADLGAALGDPATEAVLAEDVADAAAAGTGPRVVTVIVDGRIPVRLEYDAIDLLQRTIDRAIDEG